MTDDTVIRRAKVEKDNNMKYELVLELVDDNKRLNLSKTKL